MAKKKYKGRPPVFVLDENGKEVYGLSYNKSTRMYYATFSVPRVYFSAGGKTEDRRKNAIDKFSKWAEGQQLSPEQQKEKEELDRTYEKAKQLFKEGYLDKEVKDYVEQKAKELLEEAEQDKTWAGYGRFTNLVSDKANDLIRSGHFNDYIVSEFEDLLRSDVFLNYVEDLLKNRDTINIRKYLWEVLYEALEKDPIQAAKETGIPQLALIDLEKMGTDSSWSCSITWDLAWKIYDIYRPEESRYSDRKIYQLIQSKLSRVIGHKIIKDIDYNDFYDALVIVDDVNGPYKMIPIEDRLELLEEVFTCIKKAGYPQADHILFIINKAYKELCS